MSKPSKRSRKKQEVHTEEAEISHILDERGGPDDDNKASTKNNKRGRKRKSKTKHEYLCAWTDGEEPQWVDAAHLDGTPALEDWEYAKAEEDVPEIFDSKEVLDEKCATLVGWMKDAKRISFLLGAGISAPILPTFRGTNGLWTKDAHKNEKADAKVSDGLQPTKAHRAIAALEKAGFVNWVATQNYDDLSFRSGFPDSKLSELHGNIFTETCEKCHRLYRRDFEVPLDDSVDHETGRFCDDCGGTLKDSIIHFGEDLPMHAIKMANAKFLGSDLTITLGSSLQVTPAADLPFKSKRRNLRSTNIKAVIVNLQETPCDDEADLLIHGKCDEVMSSIATELLGPTWDE